VQQAGTCIQRMQKTLTEMNVQLATVLSDLSGATGNEHPTLDCGGRAGRYATDPGGVNLREPSTGEWRENGRKLREAVPHTPGIGSLRWPGEWPNLDETAGFRDIRGPEAVNLMRGVRTFESSPVAVGMPVTRHRRVAPGNFTPRPSGPGEFHPEPLTDPCLSLSTHTARATH
jgi:hypothetical protein